MSYQADSSDALESHSIQAEHAIAIKENRTAMQYVVLLAVVVASSLLVYSNRDYISNLVSTSLSSNIEDEDSVLSSYATTYSSLPKSFKKELWGEFKEKYGRTYASEDEESERYDNFEDFLELIDKNNAAEASAGGRAFHGITKFADHSLHEFKSTYLGFKMDDSLEKLLENAEVGDNYASSMGFEAEAETTEVKSWVGIQTTPVKNQGYCGSCWAFSATEQIESDSIKAGYTNTSDALSVQQVTSCDTYAYGCDGGNPVYGYYYVYKAGGIQTNASYPYTSYGGTTGTCESNKRDFKVTVTTYYYMTNEAAMEDHVLTYGPLSVCLDATTWISYTNGTLTTCGDDVNHCVQAVGINLDEKYWLVRNSWGTDWGEDGYIQLESGVNMCDITYIPTFTNAEIVDYEPTADPTESPTPKPTAKPNIF